jgi:hypothetical protein
MEYKYPIEFCFLYAHAYLKWCCKLLLPGLNFLKYMSHAWFHKSYIYIYILCFEYQNNNNNNNRYYFAEPICNKMLPNEVVVAINNKYILVVDPNSKEFLEEFPYNKVVTWGASDKAFSVVYGDLVHNRKVFFKTNQVIKQQQTDTHTYGQ